MATDFVPILLFSLFVLLLLGGLAILVWSLYTCLKNQGEDQFFKELKKRQLKKEKGPF